MARQHKSGYPQHCACGEVLHTPKAVKFHRCTKPADRAPERQTA